MNSQTLRQSLTEVYNCLFTRYGPQHWWPTESPFEVMVGAILTQSAAWGNVEKAIINLKTARALSPQGLRSLSQDELARLIHPCGYYNVKAKKLKALASWLQKYGDDPANLSDYETTYLRELLLAVFGVGEETADSILLYAIQKPVFVIDAYTRRIMTRLGLAPGSNKYTDFQSLFIENLPPHATLFNEYHALLVCLAKDACRTKPLCEGCCLREMCPRCQ